MGRVTNSDSEQEKTAAGKKDKQMIIIRRKAIERRV
jgi:hypothetical protein